jgi:hypothetical protein
MNPMITDIANFILLFSNKTIIAPLIILGYIWISRKIFYDAISLLMFSMIFNFALKNTFQVPLSPLLGKQGYAFPSGHMQTSSVLYGWLAFAFKDTLFRILVALLLIGIALSLVYFGYHNFVDIAGAVFFALLLMLAYYLISTQKPELLPWLVLSIASGLMIYIHMIDKIKSPPWMAYYTLVGFMLSEKLFGKKISPANTVNKILSTLLCFGLFFMIKGLFSIEVIHQWPRYLQQLQWVLIGISLPASLLISQTFRSKPIV